jgi:hypothetical protein
MNKQIEFVQGVVAAVTELNDINLEAMSETDRTRRLFDSCYTNLPGMESPAIVGEILKAGRGDCRRIDLLCGIKAEIGLCAVIDSAGCYYIVSASNDAVPGYNRGVTPLSSKEFGQFMASYLYALMRYVVVANGQVDEFDAAAQEAMVAKNGKISGEILKINAYQNKVFATM